MTVPWSILSTPSSTEYEVVWTPHRLNMWLETDQQNVVKQQRTTTCQNVVLFKDILIQSLCTGLSSAILEQNLPQSAPHFTYSPIPFKSNAAECETKIILRTSHTPFVKTLRLSSTLGSCTVNPDSGSWSRARRSVVFSDAEFCCCKLACWSEIFHYASIHSMGYIFRHCHRRSCPQYTTYVCELLKGEQLYYMSVASMPRCICFKRIVGKRKTNDRYTVFVPLNQLLCQR